MIHTPYIYILTQGLDVVQLAPALISLMGLNEICFYYSCKEILSKCFLMDVFFLLEVSEANPLEQVSTVSLEWILVS